MNVIEYLLTCLGEEGSEISQQCSKSNRFGLDDVNCLEPTGPDNTGRLVNELNDLLSTAALLVDVGALPADWQSKTKQEQKRLKLVKFMAYAMNRGTLQLSDTAQAAFKKLSSPAPRPVVTDACADHNPVPGTHDESASPAPSRGDVS